ncbi:MAG: hypothetical protein QXO27_04490 [Candidatus Aenigmatarchaeota archaeon]
MKKGISGIELVLMGLIGTFTIITSAFLPPSAVKVKLDSDTLFEYKDNNVQNLLLTLLSITQNGRDVSKLIAEHLSFNNPANVDFLESRMDKLVINKCYKLNSTSEILLDSSGDCEIKYNANTTIVLPYNPNKLIEEIRVGIG